MKLLVSIKQDEDRNFYFDEGNGAKWFVDPPVQLRCAGKFYPTANTDERPYHLEKLNVASGEWAPLRTAKKGEPRA